MEFLDFIFQNQWLIYLPLSRVGLRYWQSNQPLRLARGPVPLTRAPKVLLTNSEGGKDQRCWHLWLHYTITELWRPQLGSRSRAWAGHLGTSPAGGGDVLQAGFGSPLAGHSSLSPGNSAPQHLRRRKAFQFSAVLIHVKKGKPFSFFL